MTISPRNVAAPMPKSSSCIFDIEIDNDSAIKQQIVTDPMDTHVVVDELKRFLNSASPSHAQLRLDAQIPSPTTSELAAHLTSLGYYVRVRRAAGGDGRNCLQNLRHEYLSCLIPGDSSYIVDPHFIDQFCIAKSTDRYSSLLACIPQVLVIPEQHITPLVTFLCAELSAAFSASNTVLPPWRQATSMLTKWQPRKSIDEARRTSSRAEQSNQSSVISASPAFRVYGGFGSYNLGLLP